MARSGAFALALTKNSDLANFFFSTSKSSNKAVQNFNQAVDELDDEYRNRELEAGEEKVNAEKGDSFMSNIMPLQRMVGPARAYYVTGMSTDDAIAELMRLNADDSQKASSILPPQSSFWLPGSSGIVCRALSGAGEYGTISADFQTIQE